MVATATKSKPKKSYTAAGDPVRFVDWLKSLDACYEGAIGMTMDPKADTTKAHEAGLWKYLPTSMDAKGRAELKKQRAEVGRKRVKAVRKYCLSFRDWWLTVREALRWVLKHGRFARRVRQYGTEWHDLTNANKLGTKWQGRLAMNLVTNHLWRVRNWYGKVVTPHERTVLENAWHAIKIPTMRADIKWMLELFELRPPKLPELPDGFTGWWRAGELYHPFPGRRAKKKKKQA